MIDAFIRIRFKQFYRGLIGFGLFRILFLIVFLGFIGFMLFLGTSKSPDSFYVIGINLFLLLMVQTKRRDKIFLKTNFNNYHLICFVEYLIVSSITIAFLAFHSQWIPLLILVSGLYLLVYLDLKARHNNLNTKLQQLIPDESFEWKSGVRQTLFIIVPLWIIGLGTSFFVASVPIVLFILGIIPFGFYENSEPYQMILAYEKGTTQFLFLKIKMQIALFSVLTLPLIAAFMLFNYEMWYIPTIEYLIFISLHTYLVLTKYAFYESNSKSQSVQVFGAIGALGGIVPVFLPVIWLLSIVFFFKSKENLTLYLNDYN